MLRVGSPTSGKHFLEKACNRYYAPGSQLFSTMSPTRVTYCLGIQLNRLFQRHICPNEIYLADALDSFRFHCHVASDSASEQRAEDKQQ